MSTLRIRPPWPEPRSVVQSTPRSRAIRRASGVLLGPLRREGGAGTSSWSVEIRFGPTPVGPEFAEVWVIPARLKSGRPAPPSGVGCKASARVPLAACPPVLSVDTGGRAASGTPAAAEGAATPAGSGSPGWRRKPMTAPTSRRSPTAGPVAGIRRTPGSIDSTSWVALSPSRLNRGSPSRTGSPSRFSQPAKTPSSMFQPRRGIVMTVAMRVAGSGAFGIIFSPGGAA